MLRLLKTLLLWFLIAALPVQGLAAAVKASCGLAHHAGATAVTAATAHEHAHHADHTHHGDAAHGHDRNDGGTSLTNAHDIGKDGFRSACAACCIGVFAPPASVPATIHASSDNVFISPSRLHTGFIPPGLERPPRNISA